MKRTLSLPLMLLLSLAAALRAQSPPTLVWQNPLSIPFLTPLTGAQLNAVAVGGPTVPVPLDRWFNLTGITSAGFPIPNGGFDHVGRTFPAELIGSAIEWRGIRFPLGAPDVPNAVNAATISLPAGQYQTLLLLGALVDDVTPPTGTITVAYTDGTSTASTQSFSDWVVPLNFPGETIAACFPYRYWIFGPVEPYSICAYGYTIDLDPAKTVESVQLPQTPFIVLLAAALEPPALAGAITYTPAAGTILAPGTSTLSASFSPASAPASVAATASVPIEVEAPPAPIVPEILWPQPQPIAWGTALGPLQLDATAAAPVSPTPVPLAGYARAKVIDVDGATFYASGVDGNGDGYSSQQLGPAIGWRNANFSLGAPAIPDAATATSIPLPSGNFDTLYLLGTAGRRAEIAQPFTIAYSDGSSVTVPVSLSAWTSPQHFPGESIVSTGAYADTWSGGRIDGSYSVYGYQLPLDPARSVASLQLPPNTDVMILAAALGVDQTLPIAGDSTYSPPAGTLLPEGTNALGVAFTPADAGLFAPATGSNSIVVTKPQLLLHANDASRLYGTPNPAFSGSLSGELLGSTFSESFSTAATPLSAPGGYPIVPSVSGPTLPEYKLVVTDGTLTIARAPVNASIQLNHSTSAQGAPVTLTAAIVSTTSGSPSGAVQFFANGAALGSASLLQGVASLTTATLPPGANNISMQYSGDIDFLPASASASLLIEAHDFSFDAPAGTTLHVVWGSQSSLLLHLAPKGIVYESSVTLSVAGIDGGLSSAQFSPAIVGSAAGPADVRFTVALDNLAQNRSPARANYLPLAALLALPFVLRLRHRRILVTVLLVLVLAPGLSGCGSGYRNAAIPLSVTATDGTHTHTLALTLQISGPK